jgi:WXG100 family type VII secretion target
MRIYPDEMRATASAVARLKDEARNVHRRLERSWRRLDYGWQSYARENIDGYYRQVLREIERMILVLEQMQDALNRTARVILEVDHVSAAEFGLKETGAGVSAVGIETVAGSVIAGGAAAVAGTARQGETILTPMGRGVESFFESVGGYSDYLKGASDSLDTISDVWGVKHLSGLSGKPVKDVLQLTTGDLGGAIKDFSQPIGKGNQVDNLVVVGAVCEVGSEIGENWQEYDGDPGKIAGGIVFDSAVGIGVSLGASAVGTFVGASLGTLVAGPAGTVVGGKLGGIAAGLLASHFEVDEKIEDIKIGGRELDDVVTGAVDTVIDTTVETTFNAVEKGLSSVADKVASLF